MAAQRGRNEPARPVIVKKVTVIEGGRHGGAWKVAYADFVTAMMAFFLLLWLLGSTDENQRRGLADYFTPTLVKAREPSAGSDGFLGGSSLVAVDKDADRNGAGSGPPPVIRPDRAAMLQRMRARLEAGLEEGLASGERLRRLLPQVRMVETSEGVRIDLVDDADFAMFALGTTVLTADAHALIAALAGSLRDEAGGLTIRGHTDALPWRSEVGGNNWALSAGRAEATRQALLRHDIGESRFTRIEGVAERELLISSDPYDPRNRRMSILLAD